MPDNPDTDLKKNRFGAITRRLPRYRGYLILGAISLILANALLLITPYLIKLTINALEQQKPAGELLILVSWILGLTILSGFFRFLVRRTIIWMSRHLEYHLRSDLFDHLLKLSPSFYHNNRTGDIMARATNDLEAVRMMIGPGLMHTVNTIVSLTIALGFMIYLSPRLTLYAFLPMLVFPYAVNKLGNLVHRKFIRIQEQFSRLTATAQENLAGIRVIKAYRQEPAEIDNFARESEEYVGLNLNMARLQGVLFPFVRFLGAAVVLVVLAVGGSDVIRGRIDIGTLVAFFTYVGALFWPMFAMGWVVSLYQRGTASLDRINRIMRTEPEVANVDGSLHAAPMNGDIEISDLTFAYNKRPVLSNINISVKAGETVGLVGLTGSGKSTFVSLLARLYPVDSGQIAIDGIDINRWDLASLRSQIGFATQEAFLFSDSVGGNIRFGKEEIDQAAIEQAAQTAALAKDVEEFPRGYETIVGERGITLSGGQKQRTAIARAIASNPVILILDDVTSAVDTETEDEILNHLAADQGNRTRIVISHRVSSVKSADRVYYLHDGEIAEQGNHDELMALDGHYAALYRSQLLAEEIDRL